MKSIFVVSFVRTKENDHYVDSVWENLEEAQKYVEEQNDWETSELGDGDMWYIEEIEYHAK